MNRRMAILLLVVAVLASLFIIDRFVLNRPNTSIIANRPMQKAAQHTSEKRLPSAKESQFIAPLADYAVIWTRPVFSPSRQPTLIASGPRPQNTTNTSSDQPPDIEIVGIALGPDNSAVLVREDRRTVKRYYAGDLINGWTIDEISAENITIIRDDERWLIPVGVPQ